MKDMNITNDNKSGDSKEFQGNQNDGSSNQGSQSDKDSRGEDENAEDVNSSDIKQSQRDDGPGSATGTKGNNDEKADNTEENARQVRDNDKTEGSE